MVNGRRVMNGTWGQVWVNGELWLELNAAQAKYSFNKEKIGVCGNMVNDTKVTSADGTGSISVHKVYTRSNSSSVLAGKDERATIIMKLDDPDAYGAERVALYNVSFDDDTLADFAHGQVGKVTYPFTFTRHEFLDKVEA